MLFWILNVGQAASPALFVVTGVLLCGALEADVSLTGDLESDVALTGRIGGADG